MKIFTREEKDFLIEAFSLKESLDKKRAEWRDKTEALKDEFSEALKKEPLTLSGLYSDLEKLMAKENQLNDENKALYQDEVAYNDSVEPIIGKNVSYIELLKMILAS